MLRDILEKYVEQLKTLYGNKLLKVSLFGSYARGDYTNDSDIDVFILVDLDENTLRKYNHKLAEISFDFNLDNDVDIQVISMSKDYYHKWHTVHPLLQNIEKDEVHLYEAA